jgi:hypothetical protein
MKQLIILIMFMISLSSVMALQTNVTQIDNTTFLINVSNDIVLDYMKIEVYDISSNVIDALEAFVTNSIEYYIDYLPYGNYSIFVTASDTMTVPFEFKALIDMPINDTNITLPVNETNTTNTTDPIVTPTPSSGGGSRRKPVIKVVEEEPKPVVKPIANKLSTKPYWEKLEQDKPVEQPVNVIVEPIKEVVKEIKSEPILQEETKVVSKNNNTSGIVLIILLVLFVIVGLVIFFANRGNDEQM